MTAVFVNFSFQDSYACNFLGLAPAVEIPSHILSSDLFVLVDIVSPQGQVSTLQAFIYLHLSLMAFFSYCGYSLQRNLV